MRRVGQSILRLRWTLTCKGLSIKQETKAHPIGMQRAINQARDKGLSHWLSALPLEDEGFKLNKGEFRDALRLRYNKQLKRLPSNRPCGSKFDVCHALSRGRGGFVVMRHGEIRDITASMLNEICKDVEIEPRLQPITGEQMRYRRR